ncbi:MAG: hypothetical protein KC933_42005, partial [Myxococcales bacterium]|nr:hypothetical protein [Myxococcales bacterium]
RYAQVLPEAKVRDEPFRELELEVPLAFAELPPDRAELRLVAEVDLRTGDTIRRLVELARTFRLPPRQGRRGTVAAWVPLDEGEFLTLATSADGPVGEAVCAVCGCLEPAGTMLPCPLCEIPQHRDCWEFTGVCSTFGCGGKR